MTSGATLSAMGRFRRAFLSSGAMLALMVQPSKEKAMGAAASSQPRCVGAAPAAVAAAVAVANLMVASIGERSGELALLKALGATDAAVSRLMLAETAAISLLGAIVGALLGSGVAQLIGRVVFGSGITMRPMVFVLVFVLLAVTVLLASASSIRSILNLKPAEVLHGR